MPDVDALMDSGMINKHDKSGDPGHAALFGHWYVFP